MNLKFLFLFLQWGFWPYYYIIIRAAVCSCPPCFTLNLSYKLMQTQSKKKSETSRCPWGRNKGNCRSANSISASLNWLSRFDLDLLPPAPVFCSVFPSVCRTVCTFDLHPVTSVIALLSVSVNPLWNSLSSSFTSSCCLFCISPHLLCRTDLSGVILITGFCVSLGDHVIPLRGNGVSISSDRTDYFSPHWGINPNSACAFFRWNQGSFVVPRGATGQK